MEEGAHQRRGEHLACHDAGPHDGDHDRGDDAEHAVALRLVLGGEVASVDRQEGDRERAARHEVVEPVGNRERRVVCVGLPVGSEPTCDEHLAREADHAREEHRRDHHQSGRAHPSRRRARARVSGSQRLTMGGAAYATRPDLLHFVHHTLSAP
jgi:hypothetical protein